MSAYSNATTASLPFSPARPTRRSVRTRRRPDTFPTALPARSPELEAVLQLQLPPTSYSSPTRSLSHMRGVWMRPSVVRAFPLRFFPQASEMRIFQSRALTLLSPNASRGWPLLASPLPPSPPPPLPANASRRWMAHLLDDEDDLHLYKVGQLSSQHALSHQ